jgi:uncharacterized peroxidase-related enzyme
MSWIEIIPYSEAKGRLLRLYNRVKGPDDNVDNIMLAHGLRPHSMEGHMALYKSVLHHSANAVPKWFLEALGVYTSMINECAYCVEHHFSGLVRLLGDEERALAMRAGMASDSLLDAFGPREVAALVYASVLTRAPASLSEAHLNPMRANGWSDGEILEINQVVAYFNYANRTVLGLGVSPEGDVLGLSPGDSSDPENWNHG